MLQEGEAAESMLQQPCSSMLVVQPETYSVSDVPSRPAPDAPPAALRAFHEAEARSIRFCRDCKTIVLRISYRSNSDKPTPLTVHYTALFQLQKEINEALPEFHEMILGLQKKDAATTLASSVTDSKALQEDAIQARKELLVRFTRYDQLAKKIRTLRPIVDKHESSTQQRLQQSIHARATMFLQKNMFPLQSLPSLDEAAQRKQKDAESAKHQAAQGGAEQAEQVRILTEQETLLSNYLASAVKARNLDDVTALKANRDEIRAEIARLQSMAL